MPVNHSELAKLYPDSIFIFVDLNTVVIIDKEFSFLKRYKWHTDKNGYVRTSICSPRTYKPSTEDNQKRIKYLHNFILPLKSGFVTDHINGNILDNRKCNLRYATPAQNSANRSPNKGNKYKGVSEVIRLNGYIKFVAVCKSKYLGVFDTPEEAAKKYNEAALLEFGDFARLNNVPE